MNYKQIVTAREEDVHFVLCHGQAAAADAAISVVFEENEIASLPLFTHKDTKIKNHYREKIHKSIGELA
jgi:hypothetical protein